MKKTVLALTALIAATPASADCLQWGIESHGIKVCVMDDLVNRNPIWGPPSGVIGGNSFTTNAATPTCKDDRELVMRGSGLPGCARDVIEPDKQ